MTQAILTGARLRASIEGPGGRGDRRATTAPVPDLDAKALASVVAHLARSMQSSSTMTTLVDSLLKLLCAQGANRLIIPSTESPLLDKQGELKTLSMPALGREMTDTMVHELTDPTQQQRVDDGHSIETYYQTPDGQRFEVLVEPQRDGPRLTFRQAPPETETSSPPPPAGPQSPPPIPESFVAPASRPPPRVAADQSPMRPAASLGLDPRPAGRPLDPGVLGPIFAQARQTNASDILLSHGSNARLRIAGEIVELPRTAIDQGVLRAFIEPSMGARARHELHHHGSTDLALGVRVEHEACRYRVNIFLQHSGVALALRPLRATAPTLDQLQLPDELLPLVTHTSGLVLMTGRAGSGKSTTLLALIEHLNRTSPKHIITLEDPIEYEYKNRRALIHQRQVGVHVSSMREGLRAALRESPDVILVGELRDHETIQAALTAANTGHLVLGTLHAADAPMAVDRIIDGAPPREQNHGRVQLSGTLRAIVTQQLIPSRSTPGRVPAVELMRVNTAIATKIREGRNHQIQSEIQKGRSDGMLSFEVSLARLVQRGLIDLKSAMAYANDPKFMTEHLHR